MSSNYVRLSSNTVAAGAPGNASAANQVIEIQKLTSIDNESQATNITLISIDSKTATLGQKTMANSSPVVIASDQTPIPVTLPGTVAVTGTVTANIGTTNGLALDTSVNSLLKPTSTLAAVTTLGGITNTVNVAGTFFQSIQPVSVSTLPLPTGASTLTAQSTGNASLASIDTKTPALGQALAAGSTPIVLTAIQLSALTPLTSLSVNNFPATQAVSIASPVAVTGPLTDTQLRATVVKVVDGLGSTGVNGNLNLVTANTVYEAKVGATRLTSRKSVVIQATDSDMYWGYASSVTSATGTLLYKNQTIEFACDPGSTFQVYLVSILANKNAKIAEST